MTEKGAPHMTTVTIQEAQAKLSDLIHQLAPGEEMLITENNQPVAKLVASKAEKPQPVPGRCKGMMTIVAEDDEHLADFDEMYREGIRAVGAESSMNPEPAVLDELVRCIVESVHPLRIILFGSAARGEMGPNSDLDVLVVMPDGCDRLAVAQTLHCRLSGLAIAKDLVVVQASDVEQHGRNPYLIIHSALAEGKELYHAAS
jgi:uncharacterized protein